MTRVAMDDLRGAEAIELLGRVLEEARAAGLEALVEAVVWRGGRMSKLIADIVLAAVIAHDLGAPLLKVPVPEAPTGDERAAAVARVVASVGVPVLFLGGPHRAQGAEEVLEEARDVMAGGAAGLAIGRAVLNDEEPAGDGRVARGHRAPLVILTLDLGTSVTKAAVWGAEGIVALASIPLDTEHPEPGLRRAGPGGVVVVGRGRMRPSPGGAGRWARPGRQSSA